MTAVPAEAGFFMPAEWHPHERCWMAWPCRETTWNAKAGARFGNIETAREAFGQVARAIAEFEPLTMLCRPEDEAAAKAACGSGVETMVIDLSDSWVRDTGPSFVIDGKGGLAAVDWQFNAWGGNYPGFEADKALAAGLAERIDVTAYHAPFIFEGGAVHVDGEGTALVVEECILHPNRNPGMTKDRFEHYMADYLGVQKVIWLPLGLEDDETDGHVDEVACFAAPGHVLALATDDSSDANYPRLRANLEMLASVRDAKGRAFEVTTLPQPEKINYDSGIRVALSYVNFYPANGGLVMPAFSVPEDDAARAILQSVFRDRRIVQVPAFSIALGGGCIHCITQQQPVAQ